MLFLQSLNLELSEKINLFGELVNGIWKEHFSLEMMLFQFFDYFLSQLASVAQSLNSINEIPIWTQILGYLTDVATDNFKFLRRREWLKKEPDDQSQNAFFANRLSKIFI